MRNDASPPELEAEIARLDRRLAHVDSKLALHDLLVDMTLRAAETRADARRIRRDAEFTLVLRRAVRVSSRAATDADTDAPEMPIGARSRLIRHDAVNAAVRPRRLTVGSS